MKKVYALALAGLLAASSTGCIIVATDRCHRIKLDNDKRLVEIDGDLYVIDTKAGTAKRIDEDHTRVDVVIEKEDD